MSPTTIGLLGIVVLFLLIFLKMPIGFAMALAGFVGFALIGGFPQAITVLGLTPFSTVASYLFSVLPMFLIMGEFANYSGLMEDAYRTVYKWLGHLPGGLAIASVGGCAGFSAVCGSSVATAMTMTKISLPEMLKYNYKPSLATGALAAGGTLGILIPPSSSFIVYGLITEQSIGRLFMAGIIPGILLTFLFMLTIYIQCKSNPTLAPADAVRFSWKERLLAVKNVWGVLIIFLLVMGGIWGGAFTPTEAGAIGAFIAFLFLVGRRRLTKKNLAASFLGMVRTTGVAFGILIGAMIFNYFISISGLPKLLATTVSNLPIPTLGILVCILIVYIFLGCIMDTLAMVLLTIPIFFPVVVALGYDPIWFGVILTIMSEMGMITPPIGINVFIISGMAKNIPMYTIFRGIVPFVGAMVVCVILLIAFPQIALFVPNTMMGG